MRTLIERAIAVAEGQAGRGRASSPSDARETLAAEIAARVARRAQVKDARAGGAAEAPRARRATTPTCSCTRPAAQLDPSLAKLHTQLSGTAFHPWLDVGLAVQVQHDGVAERLRARARFEPDGAAVAPSADRARSRAARGARQRQRLRDQAAAARGARSSSASIRPAGASTFARLDRRPTSSSTAWFCPTTRAPSSSSCWRRSRGSARACASGVTTRSCPRGARWSCCSRARPAPARRCWRRRWPGGSARSSWSSTGRGWPRRDARSRPSSTSCSSRRGWPTRWCCSTAASSSSAGAARPTRASASAHARPRPLRRPRHPGDVDARAARSPRSIGACCLRLQLEVPTGAMREKIWRALLLPTVPLADDVDVNQIAKRYELTRAARSARPCSTRSRRRSRAARRRR